MSHRFDRAQGDPYAEAARQVENHVYSGRGDLSRGAADDTYNSLSNAIVTGLGDIAAHAFRRGVSDPQQVKNLAKAVAAACETVFAAYRGEVDPDAALNAIGDDSRLASLPEVPRHRLTTEIELTRQLEHLLLEARRLPDLIDYAGSLGLHVENDLMDQGTLLVGEHPTPTAPEAP